MIEKMSILDNFLCFLFNYYDIIKGKNEDFTAIFSFSLFGFTLFQQNSTL